MKQHEILLFSKSSMQLAGIKSSPEGAQFLSSKEVKLGHPGLNDDGLMESLDRASSTE